MLHNIISLTKSFTWKEVKERRAKQVLIPLTYAFIELFLALVAFYVPFLIIPPERVGLEHAAQQYFSSLHGNAGLAMAMIFIQGPYLLALLAAFSGAASAQKVVGGQAARGGLELLLAGPYRVREIFTSLLITAVVLTIEEWLIIVLGTLGIATLVILFLHAGFHIPIGYFALALLMPLPMALWSNLITLLLMLSFPKLTQARTNSSGDLLQLIATVPALALALLVFLAPQINPTQVAIVALVAGVLGSIIGIPLLSLRFTPETLLES